MPLQIEPVDVLIVGTGPSGTSTALHLLRQDPTWASRIIMVDKAIHPREKLCGGGVTHFGVNILAQLGIPFDIPHYPIREARLIYEDKTYSLHADPAFRIVRRDEFDHWLLQKVEALGVRVHQGEAVKEIAVHEDYVAVTTSKNTFHARVLVGADGSRSFVRRALKWDGDSNVARLLEVLTPEDATVQPEFRNHTAVFDFTRMTDGLQGYYWDFPSYVDGKPFMNRGLFDSRAQPQRPKAHLKDELNDALAQRDRQLDDYTLKGHPIRWWGKDNPLARHRVLLVGDAAGVDPLFGEGISFALAYGTVAAPAIIDAFAQQDFSFATYKEQLMREWLFRHLVLRTRLAKIAYLMKYRWFVRLGWTVARWIVPYTRWAKPTHTPTETPAAIWEEAVTKVHE